MPVYCMPGSVFMRVRIPKYFSCVSCVSRRMILCTQCVPQKTFVYPLCMPRTVTKIWGVPKFSPPEIFPPLYTPSPCANAV